MCFNHKGMNQPLHYFLFSYFFILIIQVCKDFGRHVEFEFEIGGKKMSPELEMTHTRADQKLWLRWPG